MSEYNYGTLEEIPYIMQEYLTGVCDSPLGEEGMDEINDYLNSLEAYYEKDLDLLEELSEDNQTLED